MFNKQPPPANYAGYQQPISLAQLQQMLQAGSNLQFVNCDSSIFWGSSERGDTATLQRANTQACVVP